MAQAAADVEPETITYIEAHGTATPLGDPVEFAGLRNAFQTGTDKRGYCAIGSVKTNIGHADAAAGIAGLLKTVLALQHRQLPPSLHFETPNPELDLADSPFYVNTTLRDWPQGPTPRRAGVSAFGIGGTNAHIILEEAPPQETIPAPQAWHVLPLSAKTETALNTATHNLANHLTENADLDLADVAFSLQTGRQHFSHRRFALCQTTDNAVTTLQSLDAEYVFEAIADETAPDVVFMFTGQGAQYPNMAGDLYQSQPIFRQTVDRCAEILEPHLELDLRAYIYPDQANLAAAAAQLRQTAITQPALFAIEYALAQQWLAWGAQPKAFIGHSLGEYVAACLAGVFSFEEGLALVAARGRLIQQLPGGAMLAVTLSEADLQPYLERDGSDLSIATLNTPTFSVISGPDEAIDRIQHRLTGQAITCRRLHTSHAFHSAMIEPILQPFQALVSQISLHPPKIPFVSNVTGTWISDQEATDPAYWARHLRQPVRFAAGLNTIWQNNHTLLLEVGPGQTLSTFARQHPDRPSSQRVISSLPGARESQSALATTLKAVGQLWLAGNQIDWDTLSGPEKRHRISLPPYPFERERYWLEPAVGPTQAMAIASAQRKNEIDQWLYTPSWRRSITPKQDPLPEAHYLIFQDQAGIGAAMAESLTAQGHQVTKVVMRPQFGNIAADTVGLNPQTAYQFEQLLAEFEKTPTQIVHLWNVTADDQMVDHEATFEKYQVFGYYSLLYLAQALRKRIPQEQIQLTVIANHSQSVTGDEPLIPAKATTLGLCKVIPQELPHLRCQHIDIVLPETENLNQTMLMTNLTAELSSVERQPVLAYRGRHRWVQTFDAWSTPPDEAPIPDLLKTEGVYLITGGLGNVGLVMADFLAHTVQAKLVLTGRSPFPDKVTWPDWLTQQGDDEPTGQTIRRLQALEAAGAEVVVMAADVADAAAMRQVIAQTERQFGRIDGVIHAAGVVEGETFRAVSQIEPEHVSEQFQAKVQGAFTLEKNLRGRSLDFCLLNSSLASVLGGLNFGAYAAANAFLDTFAQHMAQTSDILWLSVNWDAWTFGIEVEQEAGLGATLAALAIRPAEGQAVLKYLLTAALPQTVVSTADLQARIEEWVELKQLRNQSIASQTQEALPRSVQHARTGLNTPYVAPSTEAEEILVEIWEPLLGVEPIGVKDSFFDLGGHSLLAIQVVSRIQDAFDIAFPLDFFFDAPTIAKLAQVVEEMLIAELDELSEEEAQRLAKEL
jgi:acyl transferase domain-containing protein/acyl carrier protein